MAIASGNRKAGMFGRIAEWWGDLRAGRAGLDELRNCGSEADKIARDVGLSSSDLRLIAAKRPNAADQLEPRLAALHMDRAAFQRTDPLVVRDLERVCTLCGEKRQCERDLARHPTDAVWRTYCPNAPTLQALVEAGSRRGRQL